MPLQRSKPIAPIGVAAPVVVEIVLNVLSPSLPV